MRLRQTPKEARWGYHGDDRAISVLLTAEAKLNHEGVLPFEIGGKDGRVREGSLRNGGEYFGHVEPVLREGEMKETGRALDFAIRENANVFFAAQTPDGERFLTRNGSWRLNDDNVLVTQNGFVVLDVNNNPIHLQTEQFEVRENGIIVVDGEEVAQIQVREADAKNLIYRDGVFFGVKNWDLVRTPAEEFFNVTNKWVEASNVDSTEVGLRSAGDAAKIAAANTILSMILDSYKGLGDL